MEISNGPVAISAEPMFAVDAEQRIVAWNSPATHAFEIDRGAALGSLCFHLLGGCDIRGRRFCKLDCPVVVAAEEGKAMPSLRLNLGTNGCSAPFDVSTIVIMDKNRVGVVVHLCHRRDELREPQAHLPAQRVANRYGLTVRETQVLVRLCAGDATESIASGLCVSQTTVRNHMQRVLEKLDVHSRAEAVALVYRS